MKTQKSKHAGRTPQPFITRECTIPRDYPVPICNEFADLLIQEREKRDLTRYAVAKYAHVSKRTVDFLETKANSASLDVASRLLYVFGMRLKIVRERPNRQI